MTTSNEILEKVKNEAGDLLASQLDKWKDELSPKAKDFLKDIGKEVLHQEFLIRTAPTPEKKREYEDNLDDLEARAKGRIKKEAIAKTKETGEFLIKLVQLVVGIVKAGLQLPI